MRRETFAVGALLVLLACAGCGFRPYRAMAKSATSEETVFAQIEDRRTKTAMREALLKDDLTEALHITPYAYMGHGFLVGFVDNPEQRQAAIEAVQRLDGVQWLDTYLPEQPTGAEQSATSRMASDASIKGEIKGALALDPDNVVARVEIEVLDAHVVLLGVVSSESAIESAEAKAQAANGVTGVTNFLLLPDAEHERMRPSLR
jgi:hyperosmotically inducible protein